jgi:hypothetical protein
LSSPDNPQFEPQAPVNAEVQPQAYEQGDPFAAAAPIAVPVGPPPVENPIWNGWDVLAIFALILVTIFVLQLGILFGARALFYPQTSLVDLAQRPLLLLLSQFLIDGAAALYIFFYIEGKYHTNFWPAIRWNWPRSAWKLLGMGAVLLFGLTALQSVLPMPKDTPFDKLFGRPRDAYLLALIAVTVAPFVEELFFRGLLYPVIARRWGVAWGIFLTALPFALMHLPQYGYAWGVMLVILIVGVACGMVRAATKSVAASFLIHAGYNGTQMLIAVVVTHGFRTMPKAALWLW